MTPARALALQQIAEAAAAAETQTGCPALVTVCQCIQESGWLVHAPGNNPFGVKTRADGERQLLETVEWFTNAQAEAFMKRGDGRELKRDPTWASNGVRKRYIVKDWFARYDSMASAFIAHGHLLMTGRPYRKAAGQYRLDGDVMKFMDSIATVYATSPEYGQSLRRVAGMQSVREALETQA